MYTRNAIPRPWKKCHVIVDSLFVSLCLSLLHTPVGLMITHNKSKLNFTRIRIT
jgi:uncharacterized membrane protein AbrB (regulator of aidB expression)